MKLYTEEQVIKAINLALSEEQVIRLIKLALNSPTHVDIVLDHLSSIELPTDEEIKKESHNYFMRGQLGFEAAADTERAFLRGVLWMRDKILNK